MNSSHKVIEALEDVDTRSAPVKDPNLRVGTFERPDRSGCRDLPRLSLLLNLRNVFVFVFFSKSNSLNRVEKTCC